jgi:pimeloyl-ACP methyl ester carboxylesterase
MKKLFPSSFGKLSLTLVVIFVFAAISFGEIQAQTQWPRVAISKDGTPVSYEVYGTAEPTLVFVHGWSCDSRYFREQVKHFSKTHRVVVLDLAGHGHSGMARTKYTMQAFGEDVKAVTKAVGSSSVILIGHSMSGQVIAEAAALMPGKVLGLIGIDTIEDVEYKLTEEELKKWAAPLQENFQTGSKKFVEGMISPKTDPKIQEFILSDMSSAPPNVALSAFREMMAQYINGDAAAIFDKVRVPVISVNADKWPINYEGNRRHMLFYDAIVLKDADHFLMMDRPDEFNGALDKAIQIIIEKAKPIRAQQSLPPEQNRMKQGDASTPYSAEQIRKALPKGSWIKFNNELSGGQKMVLVFHFGKGNNKEAALVVDTLDEKGNPIAEPRSSKPLWKELQSHASFPAETATIISAPLKTFKGDLDCWLYEVREGEAITKYWFAKELPGPPVLLEEYKNGMLQRKMVMAGRGVKR